MGDAPCRWNGVTARPATKQTSLSFAPPPPLRPCVASKRRAAPVSARPIRRPRGTPSHLPPPSHEQDLIIASLLAPASVVCSALAGTGKTTTTLLAVERLGVDAVIITYNKALQTDTQERIDKTGLSSLVRVYTFHALFRAQMTAPDGTSVLVDIKDDDSLYANLVHWRVGKHTPRRLEVGFVCIDELQDLCPLYYDCLGYVMPLAPVLMLVVGDLNQMLYGFKSSELKADQVYMEHAPAKFGKFTGVHSWERRALTTSYRLTPNVARLVNQVWGTSIVAGNTRSPNHPVEYWHLNVYDTPAVSKRIQHLLVTQGVENVLILNCSVKNGAAAQTPLQRVLNELGACRNEQGDRLFNFHVSDAKDGGKQAMDATALQNKARVWTYCASKGTEAPVVVVFGFSAPNAQRAAECRNQMGVALSRSSGRLIVIHSRNPNPRKQERYWPGMDRATLASLIEDGAVNMYKGGGARDALPPNVHVDCYGGRSCSLRASDLQHVSPREFAHLFQGVVCATTQLRDARAVALSTRARFQTGVLPTTEEFSCLLGTAIPFAFELQRTGRIKGVDQMIEAIPIRASAKYTSDRFHDLLERHRVVYSARQELVRELRFEGEPGKESLVGKDILKRMERLRVVNRRGLELEAIDEVFYDTHFKPHMQWIRHVYDLPTKIAAHFLFLANAYHAFGKSHYLWLQVGTEFGVYEEWVDEAGFADALANLHRMATPASMSFEVEVGWPITPSFRKGIFTYDRYSARPDAVSGSDVYEFKCKDDISDADRVQLLTGAALICLKLDERQVRGKLLNYKTGETWEATLSRAEAESFLTKLAGVYAAR